MPGVRNFQYKTHLGHIHRLHRPNRIKRPEPVSLVAQQAMHVPDMHEIVLVFRGDADGVFPFVNELMGGRGSASEETMGQIDSATGGPFGTRSKIEREHGTRRH
jgi:hypothetical protein